MKFIRSISILALLAGAVFITGCANTPSGGAYTVKAFKPHNPNDVVVKVSLSTQNIYVKEGNRLLMAVQGTVGEAKNPTPTGNFHIEEKIKDKRSGTFGFTRSGGPADAHKGQDVAVGYPMAFWCGFSPGYGFHQGFVWDIPRTHGCIRLHKEAVARLYALVKIGTPVSIQRTQPEDAEYGHFVRKLDQRNDPDPSPSRLMSQSYFTDPPGPLLIDDTVKQ
jgi:L,D-transpeptidase catalytic domain